MQSLKLKNYEYAPKNYTGIVEYSNGDKYWYKEGKHHREDGPAVEWKDGYKEWWVEGKLHRLDGPAREWANGEKEWFIEGKQHREDGPAREYSDGTKYWYKEGKRHRTDGPAVEWTDGTKEWWVEGKLHREDGPAIEWGENVISCLLDEIMYLNKDLEILIKESIFLGIEKGKYGIEWLKFLTENKGIEVIPNFRKLKEADIQKEIKIK